MSLSLPLTLIDTVTFLLEWTVITSTFHLVSQRVTGQIFGQILCYYLFFFLVCQLVFQGFGLFVKCCKSVFINAQCLIFHMTSWQHTFKCLVWSDQHFKIKWKSFETFIFEKQQIHNAIIWYVAQLSKTIIKQNKSLTQPKWVSIIDIKEETQLMS